MKTIKNNILLIIVVLSGYFIQAQPIQMTIPDDPTHTVGDIIIIPVNVDNSLTGFEVLSYQFRISFNSARLSFNSIDVAGTMSDSWGTLIYNNSEPNYINIANASTTALAGTGTLFNLSFTCIASGGSWISFDGDEANNYFNEGYPPMLYEDGYIAVSALPTINIYPDVGLLSVGEQLQFSVSGGSAPYTWDVTDPAVASIVSNGTNTGLLTALYQGFTKVNVEDDNGITDETTDFVEVRALKLTIPDTSEWQGGVIEIPVYTTSLDGLGIMSGEMDFTFNGNILTPTGYNTTGTLTDGYSFAFNNNIAGALNISFAGTTPLLGSGVLFYIQFDISAVNSGPTWISFGNAIFNESIPAKTVNGYFTMISFGTIYISPNTYSIVAGETKQFVASGGVPPYNTWSSSDPTIASIDGAGILTAHKSGIIQITAIDNVGASGTSGNIDVYDTYVSLPQVNGSLVTTYDMPVLMSTLPAGQEVFAIQGIISFESPELEAVEIIEAGTMTDGWMNFAQNISGNTIIFAGAGIFSFNSPGVMFKVRFQLTPDLIDGENAWVHIDHIQLNEGIPLPLTVNGGITGTAGVIVSLDAFLEGPFNVTGMTTDLNPSIIPNNQPYNTAPWSYPGTESIGAPPNGDVVDWILVELRETVGGAAAAIPGTRIARQAGFILRDGSIVATDGISNLIFGVTVTNNLYALVWHRNHLGIMSAIPLTFGGGLYSYDYRTAAGQAYLSGQQNLGGGNYGMYAGDADGNGEVHQDDIDLRWSVEAGESGYFGGDFDMNSQVNNEDKNDVWLPNINLTDQVPD